MISFQVNLHFGTKELSACSSLGVVYASSLMRLIRKIQTKFNLRIEEIELTFQPE